MRVAFKDSLGIAKAVQYENRGAWGESLEGIGFSKLNKNRYSYSTYENQEDFGINVFDAHARVYDAITPRFWQIDPLAEISRRFSPYTYANDNPMRFIDPDGMDAVDVNGGVMYTGDDAKNAYIQLQKNRPKEEDPKKEDQGRRYGERYLFGKELYTYKGNGEYKKHIEAIEPDYTLESFYIGGKIFKPLGPLLGGIWARLIGKTVEKEIPAFIGLVSKKAYTSEQILNLFQGEGDDLYRFIYRGMTGSESGSGALFLAEDASYAATYVKNGYGVATFKIPAHNFQLMLMDGIIETGPGVHGAAKGVEYVIRSQAVKDIFLKTAIIK